ncbi:MAG: T9SS type A sorting domain-containing protein [Bacteroidota bacterium]
MKRIFLFYLLLVIVSSTGQLMAQENSEMNYLKSFQSQLYFEENLGQYNDSVLFQTHMLNRQVRFLASGPSYAEVRELEGDPSPNNPEQRRFENYAWLGEREAEHEALVWNAKFLNTSDDMQVKGKGVMPGTFNYFRGGNGLGNAQGVKRYAELWYEEIYPHMDLRYYGTEKHAIKYDFILNAGADIADIEVEFEGIDAFEIDEAGKLVIHTAWGDVIDAAPYSYQMGYEGEIAVEVRYKKLTTYKLGFEIVGSYDPDKPLILDPLTLSWATFYHSSSSDDYIMAVDVDADENIYAAGYTKSTTFPVTPGSYENIYGGGIDCYIVKLVAGGTAPEYATFIGGSAWEMAYGLRVNAAGEAFITGFTASSDFPVSTAAYQLAMEGGGVDGFVVRINADGSDLVYSTYMGGSDRDYMYDLEVNSASEAYITGYTYSTDYPTTTGSYNPSYSGNGDAMITRLSADGTSLVFSTLYGGINYDISNSISLGAADEIYICGNTASINLPLSVQNVQDTLNYASGLTIEDAFVARFSADGSSLEYASYLGGTNSDGAYGMDISPAGEMYITGTTYSEDFPTSIAAMQNASSPNLGSGDVFVAKIDPNDNEVDYATYVAGSDIDFVKSLVINSYGEAHILGATRSDNWPVTAYAAGHSNQYDLFVTVLNADGSALLESDLIGGSYNDYPRASGSMRYIDDKLIIGATTHSADIPLTGVTYQGSKTNGLADSPWIGSVAIDVTLPVELNSFDVVWDAADQAVKMEWLVFESTPEEGANYFIERRSKGKDWERVGKQGLQGNEELVNLYRFSDKAIEGLAGQEIVYRIRYESPNGAGSYSLSKSLYIPTNNFVSVQLYPNPVKDVLQVELLLKESSSRLGIALLDIMGRIVYLDYALGDTENQVLQRNIDVSGLSSGIYHLQIWDQNGQQIVRNVIKD